MYLSVSACAVKAFVCIWEGVVCVCLEVVNEGKCVVYTCDSGICYSKWPYVCVCPAS